MLTVAGVSDKIIKKIVGHKGQGVTEVVYTHFSKKQTNRSLFYLVKMYVEQIEAGDTYKVLKRCVSISLLNFTLFLDTEEFYSCFHLREDKRNTIYTDKMEFHVLEFPKVDFFFYPLFFLHIPFFQIFFYPICHSYSIPWIKLLVIC